MSTSVKQDPRIYFITEGMVSSEGSKLLNTHQTLINRILLIRVLAKPQDNCVAVETFTDFNTENAVLWLNYSHGQTE